MDNRVFELNELFFKKNIFNIFVSVVCVCKGWYMFVFL